MATCVQHGRDESIVQHHLVVAAHLANTGHAEGDETLQITVRDDIGSYAVDPANTTATLTIADDAPTVSIPTNKIAWAARKPL